MSKAKSTKLAPIFEKKSNKGGTESKDAKGSNPQPQLESDNDKAAAIDEQKRNWLLGPGKWKFPRDQLLVKPDGMSSKVHVITVLPEPLIRNGNLGAPKRNWKQFPSRLRNGTTTGRSSTVWFASKATILLTAASNT